MAFRIHQLFLLFILCIASGLLSETSAIYLPPPPGLECIEDWTNAPKCNQDCLNKGFTKGGIEIIYLNQYFRCCCHRD
ncbi:unnamed protein product [Trifolium pratense]|uniref:Uncharacterized protein n=1 Tax=Trifolium pratense TaxID=57577 RepID=A0ACB0L316_TRIPR|nr:unnamed protein product [Trifolium pratense]